MPSLPAVTPRERRAVRDFAALTDGPGRGGARLAARSGVGPLVELAGALRLPVAGPDRDFQVALRARLLAEGVTLPRPRTAPRESGGPSTARAPAGVNVPGAAAGGRRITVPVLRPLGVLGAVVLAVLAALVPASGGALPGDPLYGVKRTLESARMSLAGSDAERGAVLLDEARTRLTELEALLAGVAPGAAGSGGQDPGEDHVGLALRDLGAQAEQGSGLLLEHFRERRDPADLARIADFLARATPRLGAVAPRVPTSQSPRLSDVRHVLVGIGARLDAALQDCAACGAIVAAPGAVDGVGRPGAGPAATPPGATPDQPSGQGSAGGGPGAQGGPAAGSGGSAAGDDAAAAPGAGVGGGGVGPGTATPTGSPPGVGTGKPSGVGTGKPSGVGTGKPSGVGTGKPSGVGTGKPSGVGTGKPSGVGTGKPTGVGGAAAALSAGVGVEAADCQAGPAPRRC